MSAERADRVRAQERRERAERRVRRRPEAGPEESTRRSETEPRGSQRRREPPPRRERSRGSDLFARVVVAIPLAFIAIVFVDIGGAAWMGLMAVISVLCLMELYRMLERWRPVAVVGYAAAVALVIAARYGSQGTVLEVAMASLPVTFLAVVIWSPPAQKNIPTVAIAGTVLGIVWIGLGFAHAELLRQLPHGKSIVLDVMLGTFLADTGAYVGGRMFGHTPLAPAISPNKTVEGLFLGMFTAVLTVFIAGRFQQTWLTEGDSLLLGLAVAVLGPIGDLFESIVKRDAGAKDAGTLFGAHGGALDRLDAVIFTVVGGYYVWLGLLH
jgi:phosphatidate cytidylyltransferase